MEDFATTVARIRLRAWHMAVCLHVEKEYPLTAGSLSHPPLASAPALLSEEIARAQTSLYSQMGIDPFCLYVSSVTARTIEDAKIQRLLTEKRDSAVRDYIHTNLTRVLARYF